MLSYFAIISPDNNTSPLARQLVHAIKDIHPSYTVALDSGNMVLLHSGSQTKGFHTYSLHAGRGAIVGTLFNHTTNQIAKQVPPQINRGETDHIISTHGRHLISHYWGRYTAFIEGADNNEFHIIPDPTGIMPTYYYIHNGVIIIFSDFEQFCQLKLSRLSINLDHIYCYLKNPFLPYSDTGTLEIEKILPGNALTIRPNGNIQSHVYWRLTDFARSILTTDAHEAANLLRQTVLDCIHAWAAEYDNIILSLSGGLDSSIVLSCLSLAPNSPKVTCFNTYTTGDISDERKYARLAASNAGFEIKEIPEDPADVDLADIEHFHIARNLLGIPFDSGV